MDILMIGPDPNYPGGMATVTNTIAEGVTGRGDLSIQVINSGGGRGPAGWFRFPIALTRVLLRPGDVVHLHVATRGSTLRKALFAGAALLRRRPYVIHLHGGGYADFTAELAPPVLWAVRRFFNTAECVIALGEFWRQFVLTELKVSPEKICVVRNGVRGVTRADGPLPLNFVFLGNVTRRKGADVLMDVAPECLDASPTMALHVIGPLGEEDLAGRGRELERLYPGRFVLHGPLVGQAKERQLASAHVFVLPSRVEGLPMALLEAMSAGLAPIVTPVGAIPEVVVHQENGVLVPAEDPVALARALQELADNQELRERLGSAAQRTWREEFSAELMVSEIVSIWLRIGSASR